MYTEYISGPDSLNGFNWLSPVPYDAVLCLLGFESGRIRRSNVSKFFSVSTAHRKHLRKHTNIITIMSTSYHSKHESDFSEENNAVFLSWLRNQSDNS